VRTSQHFALLAILVKIEFLIRDIANVLKDFMNMKMNYYVKVKLELALIYI
jgi:hypothetical protein